MIDSSGDRRRGSWWAILSVLAAITGLLAIAVPFVASVIATVALGWLLVFSGGVHFWLTFEPQRWGSRLWHILAALIYVFGGAYLTLLPHLGLLSLTLLLSAMLFISGLFRVFAFFSLLRKLGAFWLLVDGIITILIAGLLYFTWPESSHWAIGTLVGVGLLWNGIANCMFSFAARRHHHSDNVPDGRVEIPSP